jgi:predicted nucleic acid-binding protein
MQVLDASAVVAALVDDGAEGRWCEDQLLAGDLVAPHLLPVEVANILRRTEAHEALDASEASAALRDLRRLDVELVPFEALAERTWELRANLTTYDACYAATAELFGCRLVTLDPKLAKAPGLRCEVAVAP